MERLIKRRQMQKTLENVGKELGDVSHNFVKIFLAKRDHNSRWALSTYGFEIKISPNNSAKDRKE